MIKKTKKYNKQNLFDYLLTSYGTMDKLSDYITQNNIEDLLSFEESSIDSTYVADVTNNKILTNYNRTNYIVGTEDKERRYTCGALSIVESSPYVIGQDITVRKDITNDKYVSGDFTLSFDVDGGTPVTVNHTIAAYSTTTFEAVLTLPSEVGSVDINVTGDCEDSTTITTELPSVYLDLVNVGPPTTVYSGTAVGVVQAFQATFDHTLSFVEIYLRQIDATYGDFNMYFATGPVVSGVTLLADLPVLSSYVANTSDSVGTETFGGQVYNKYFIPVSQAITNGSVYYLCFDRDGTNKSINGYIATTSQWYSQIHYSAQGFGDFDDVLFDIDKTMYLKLY